MSGIGLIEGGRVWTDTVRVVYVVIPTLDGGVILTDYFLGTIFFLRGRFFAAFCNLGILDFLISWW